MGRATKFKAMRRAVRKMNLDPLRARLMYRALKRTFMGKMK